MGRQKILAMLISGVIGIASLTGCGTDQKKDKEDDNGQGGYSSGHYSYYGGSGTRSILSKISSGLGSSAKGSAAS